MEDNIGELLTDCVGEVMGALKWMRPWQTAIGAALARLIG
jgi:hypothetical protein